MKTEKQFTKICEKKLEIVINTCKSQLQLRDGSPSKPTEFDNGVTYLASMILRKIEEE